MISFRLMESDRKTISKLKTHTLFAKMMPRRRDRTSTGSTGIWVGR